MMSEINRQLTFSENSLAIILFFPMMNSLHGAKLSTTIFLENRLILCTCVGGEFSFGANFACQI